MNVWKHRRYLDLWSVVHVLSGAALAFGLSGMGVGPALATVLALLLLCLWEVFERFIRISEAFENVCADLCIGMLGFGIGAYWLHVLDHPFDSRIFFVLGALAALMALWGFLDLLFRGYR